MTRIFFIYNNIAYAITLAPVLLAYHLCYLYLTRAYVIADAADF